MSTFYVLRNLYHDNKAYVPSDEISIVDDRPCVAVLLSSSVISRTKGAKEARVEIPVVEQKPETFVAGAPIDSGEPSIDGNAASDEATKATDMTPVVEDLSSLKRAELEAIAAEKGLSNGDIKSASNKAELIEKIKSVDEDSEVDPSENL